VGVSLFTLLSPVVYWLLLLVTALVAVVIASLAVVGFFTNTFFVSGCLHRCCMTVVSDFGFTDCACIHMYLSIYTYIYIYICICTYVHSVLSSAMSGYHTNMNTHEHRCKCIYIYIYVYKVDTAITAKKAVPAILVGVGYCGGYYLPVV
jgi:hypothetical protein